MTHFLIVYTIIKSFLTDRSMMIIFRRSWDQYKHRNKALSLVLMTNRSGKQHRYILTITISAKMCQPWWTSAKIRANNQTQKACKIVSKHWRLKPAESMEFCYGWCAIDFPAHHVECLFFKVWKTCGELFCKRVASHNNGLYQMLSLHHHTWLGW